MKAFITALTITLTACVLTGCATEYHVSTAGLDSNPGTRSKPFKTISRAAEVAQPGDTITVHEGIYRERVNPPRGGTSDKKRIVYQAADGKLSLTVSGPARLASPKEIAGLSSISGGDNRFHNNILAGSRLDVYNSSKPPMLVNGNVYPKGAKPFRGEENYINKPEFDPDIKLIEEKDAVYLEISLPQALDSQQNKLVTTKLLGKTRVAGTAFENPDGSPVTIDSDYFGRKRNKLNPFAGPFERPGKGKLRLKVWQRNP